jgi:hypothetical protein
MVVGKNRIGMVHCIGERRALIEAERAVEVGTDLGHGVAPVRDRELVHGGALGAREGDLRVEGIAVVAHTFLSLLAAPKDAASFRAHEHHGLVLDEARAHDVRIPLVQAPVAAIVFDLHVCDEVLLLPELGAVALLAAGEEEQNN